MPGLAGYRRVRGQRPPRLTATAGDAAPGPYRWQAVRVEANCVYTNTGLAGSLPERVWRRIQELQIS